MDRESLQGIAAHRLAKEHRLICQWATGVGKTNVALRFLKDNPWMTCLILVPEQNNIENWTDEFKKFNIPMDDVQIVCYASLHKYKDTSWDLVVFDEAPHMDTEKRKAICRSVRGDYILALGAVIDDDERLALESVYGEFEKSVVSLADAVKWGILPPPRIYVVHMGMDDSIRRYWHNGRNLTAKQMYAEIARKVDKAVTDYNNNATPFNRSKMYRAGNERKRFLGSLKDEAVSRICSYLEQKKKRFICFCSSIKQAEALGGEHAFTSKSMVAFQHLNKFNNHEINSLFVVGKLIEGQNLKDIDCGIITQLGGTSRITVQEIGRVLRSTNPLVYIPVFDGTKDESFLYTVTSNIPTEYIKHINL